ncbi:MULTISPECIES: sugar ABC transporter ATP-binding protein [unclassified Sporosarcina]|uniref:sugar ABC transporter ATP-binding protein n=1 Tax=unclassified Sporosarcina TaxID=2647733 RepID=UPI00203B87F7|nr:MULTISPECIES: sugar ABC transporter ATP-binding protein [unclassified Sporosarcina]GKV65858.1 ribose import ATP-binding protein RbsA [Sporosarcina sp. NCCP-2331]GLB55983.1 ribose import ATP-binding protein RbsA [Sporosarcina sp. NCCP-2378]
MLLELKGICKSFSGVQVLKDIDIQVESGEIHVLLGENGAGKSTIIKIITGAYSKDEGDLRWKNEELVVSKPSDSIDAGIGTIYQELNLVPELSVMENIFLGNEKKSGGKFSLLDRKKMREEAKAIMETLGQRVDPDTLVSELGVGQQQLIEIAKALSLNCELIIMDEPTSSLSEREAEQLLQTIERLKNQGMTIIYISHRLEEIKRISDRITILRDGAKIATVDTATTSIDKMISLMVGRSLDNKFPKHEFKKGKEILRVKDMQLTADSPVINFTAYQGEILGISGLVGAGRTELARAIFGADTIYRGETYIDGEKQVIRNPIDAIKAGLAFITEDRKEEGLFLDQSLIFNKTISNINNVKRNGLINVSRQREIANKYVKELSIRPNNVDLMTRHLSGGNQQKVVIAKWLFTDARIFIFDEPTRGIDVGAKVEVYNLMNYLVENGAGVIVISSELPEILGISDRILVMNEGKISADLDRINADQEIIMKAATGGH